MMNHNEINPHEILEIAPGATRGEIERAYYLARLAYGSDSLASYSLYTPGERTAILDRIERAYRLLLEEAQASERDGRKRREEGPAMQEGGVEPEDGRRGIEPALQGDLASEPGVALGFGEPPPVRSRDAARPIPARPQLEATDVPRPYDAGALHAVRESRGISLEEISAQTKISLKNLRLIESGEYALLPPVVYLRGYLTQYARCLRLSPTEVLADFLEAAGEQGEKSGKHE